MNQSQNKKNNKLLKSGFWEYNAWLDHINRDYGYIEGYRRSADILVNYIQDKTVDQDILIYPIVFLYRHHIELRLKELIKEGRSLLGKDYKKYEKHNIDFLWRECKKISKEIEPESEKNFQSIEKVIKDLHKIDKGSFNFRYSTDKKGNRSIDPELKIINIKEFSKSINEAICLLEGASCQFSYLQDCKQEINEIKRAKRAERHNWRNNFNLTE